MTVDGLPVSREGLPTAVPWSFLTAEALGRLQLWDERPDLSGGPWDPGLLGRVPAFLSLLQGTLCGPGVGNRMAHSGRGALTHSRFC